MQRYAVIILATIRNRGDAYAASKAKKPTESQVWLDTDLYRKIERFNVCRGKPVPTKHVVNAILQMFLDENKTEIQKTMKSL